MNPEVEQKKELSKAALGFDALIGACEDLGIPFMIKGRHSSYGNKIKTCTVIVNNKSFTAIGEVAEYESLKAAITYLVKTFAAFEDIRKEFFEEKESVQGLA